MHFCTTFNKGKWAHSLNKSIFGYENLSLKLSLVLDHIFTGNPTNTHKKYNKNQS